MRARARQGVPAGQADERVDEEREGEGGGHEETGRLQPAPGLALQVGGRLRPAMSAAAEDSAAVRGPMSSAVLMRRHYTRSPQFT
jgi:hypothetical protein